jgi:predicted DNA-binding transcriptional regulator AlpA
MKLLRSDEVRQLLGSYSPAHFEKIVKHPDFPKPVKAYPGARALMWFDDEINAYLDKLRQGREQENGRN